MISFLDLPSEVLLATYSFVRSSQAILPTAIQ